MSLVACQRDATLRALDAEVLRCTPAGDLWEVVLDDTILYPEGGGQPADHGTIGGATVVDVQHRDGQVVHSTTSPVPVGPARVEVDWARRFDHMQQHTAQHLLTAVALERFGWNTTSFHLFSRKDGRVPRCDIEVDGDPIDAQLIELERAVNAAIRANHRVAAKTLSRGEYEALPIRSRGLPESVTEVRVVEIEGVDANTCGGTHVGSTGELQALKLLGTERLRGGTRLFFAAGDRVLDLLQDANERTEALSRQLSEGPDTHVEAVSRVFDRARSAEKALSALQVELAELLGADLAARSGEILTLHRDGADIPFLNALANRALVDGDARLLLLTAGESEGLFLLVGPPAVVAGHKAALLEVLGARGGGKPGRLQGRATRLDRRAEAVALLSGKP